MSELQIETASEVTAELVEAVNRMLPQLTSSPKALDRKDLEAIVASSSAQKTIRGSAFRPVRHRSGQR
jgi:hypothetical protein